MAGDYVEARKGKKSDGRCLESVAEQLKEVRQVLDFFGGMAEAL